MTEILCIHCQSVILIVCDYIYVESMTKIILLIFLTQLTSYGDELKIILNKYCLECHGGKKTKGDVNFKNYSGIEHIYKNHETWKLVIHQVQQSEMPPEDETQMTPQEKKASSKNTK